MMAEVRGSSLKPRKSTVPTEVAMSTMQTAMKMALIQKHKTDPGRPFGRAYRQPRPIRTG